VLLVHGPVLAESAIAAWSIMLCTISCGGDSCCMEGGISLYLYFSQTNLVGLREAASGASSFFHKNKSCSGG
jgi:hypothetical protein